MDPIPRFLLSAAAAPSDVDFLLGGSPAEQVREASRVRYITCELVCTRAHEETRSGEFGLAVEMRHLVFVEWWRESGANDFLVVVAVASPTPLKTFGGESGLDSWAASACDPMSLYNWCQGGASSLASGQRPMRGPACATSGKPHNSEAIFKVALV